NISNSAFAAADAQGAVDQSLTGRWAALDNQLLDLKVTVGEALIPAVKELAPVLKEILVPIADIVKQNPELAAMAGKWALLSVGASSVLSPVLSAGASVTSFAGNVIDLTGKTSDFLFKTDELGSGLKGMVRYTRSAGGALVNTFGPAVMTAVRASMAWSAALLANPITWIVVGVALAALVIYKYWEPISGFFTGLWSDIVGAWNAAPAFFSELWNSIPIMVSDAMQGVLNWLGSFSLFQAGANVLGTLVDGIQSMASAPVNAVLDVVTKVRRLLPFSPAKDGPLRDLHKVKLVETIAGAVRPQPLVTAMRGAALAGMAAVTSVPMAELSPMPSGSMLAGRGGVSGMSGGLSIGSITIQLQGGDQSAVAQIEAWISNPDNAERVAVTVANFHQRQARAEFS
ncbi:MAG TPA: hypothetical protein VN764_17155, partial [Polyangiaceae bacterium]|nr:hypothetical protein [Polyangiaceae bacterium]